MLEYLRIKNFALLENVEMEFSSGLNILTGESGAGKSFIIKALMFLMANKMPASIVRSGCESTCVEAVFSTPKEELIIRRELSATSGRSRFFLNDTLTSQETIKGLREGLLLYTSQHAQQKLLQPAFHTAFLDSFLKNEDILHKRDSILQELRICKKQQEELELKFSFLAERRDLLEFQQKEIQEVNPQPQEEIELESQKTLWKNAKNSIDLLHSATEIIDGNSSSSLLQGIEDLRKILHTISTIEEHFIEDVTAMEEIRILLETTFKKLQQPLISIPNYDIEKIEARLYELSKLKRSLHRNIEEICLLEQEIDENLSFLDSCELDMKFLQKEEIRLSNALQNILVDINTRRHNGATLLCKNLEERLIPLGFTKNCTVHFTFTPQEIWNTCFEDKARIAWCPNPGHPPMPLDTIASGGELSRFLLAISSIISANSTQSLIFDEVDTGIGGNTLKSVAERIIELAKHQQILLITHWQQMAKYADKHFLIEKHVAKGITTTNVLLLEEEGRIQELHRMSGE